MALASTRASSRVLSPFRAVGVISNHVALSIQVRGTEHFVTTAVGKTFHIYNNDDSRPSSSAGIPGVRRVGEERQAEEDEHETVETSIAAKEGWTRSLTLLPSFDSEKLTNKLIKNANTMPNSGTAPKAYRNKKHGYRLWKEGYVRGVLVKPNIKAKKTLFIVRAKVHVSMKSCHYDVYVHLDQCDGEVLFAKCNCKAGQGGCCKHVAALLYALLDFINMDAKEVPKDLTCTQVGQRWNVPSESTQGVKVFKFNNLIFEKAEENKKRKRPLLTGSRDKFCATPPFAQETTSKELQDLVANLHLAGRASLFCETLESNDFQPCTAFETSSSKALAQKSFIIMQSEEENISHIHELYEHLHVQSTYEGLFSPEIHEAILSKVGISPKESLSICHKTLLQSEEPIWYLERSKRITASIFGKILNRRRTVYPKSLIQTVIEKKETRSNVMPVALRWGIDNEAVAIAKYEAYSGVIIKKCGLVISPEWPWLGCSPDGLIMENSSLFGCVEVKCPYSKREMKLEEAAASDKTFCLRSVDGKLELKRTHQYHFQCQGVMNILGLKWIDFIVNRLSC
eukprot:Seg1542.8 transcript_id=Seg1542.8/GoldUCD/mRNA.D3Y31 product="U3 small nucleolar RNA-associated protein 21" protein_id=Seg1542.8/GoldUCD/D3Y31